ncbi:GntR family transcriptional regulator [Providencia rettgeri]|nr:GntR family transcriptional regulator [Providencia rettgeri]
MVRSKNIRYGSINEFLDAIHKNLLTSPFPSQSSLAEMFNISRTTVRHILEYLLEKKIIEKQGNEYHVIRYPNKTDFFPVESSLPDQQIVLFEKAFYQMIKRKELMPGDTFTELQLAKKSHVSSSVVREFLVEFSRYGLIKNTHRGNWHMMKFSREYAEKLFEFRELLETNALTHFLNLPPDDHRWILAKELLLKHRTLRETVTINYRDFSQLDYELHSLILSGANNPFFNQSLEIITVIFHFQYQWDESDLKERNVLAIEEHMTILSALISRNDIVAMNELRHHLDTAKRTMINSIQQTYE